MKTTVSFSEFCFTGSKLLAYLAFNIATVQTLRSAGNASILNELIGGLITTCVLLVVARYQYYRYKKNQEVLNDTLSKEEYQRVLKALNALGTSFAIGDVLLESKVRRLLERFVK